MTEKRWIDKTAEELITDAEILIKNYKQSEQQRRSTVTATQETMTTKAQRKNPRDITIGSFEGQTDVAQPVTTAEGMMIPMNMKKSRSKVSKELAKRDMRWVLIVQDPGTFDAVSCAGVDIEMLAPTIFLLGFASKAQMGIFLRANQVEILGSRIWRGHAKLLQKVQSVRF